MVYSDIPCTTGGIINGLCYFQVVNDICILPSSERVASCDGTIHVWNSQTGKAISVIAESSADSVQSFMQSSSAVKVNTEQTSMLNSYPLSTGILTSVDGSSYTCMHFLDSVEKLVAGTGNGSLRYDKPDPNRNLYPRNLPKCFKRRWGVGGFHLA